MIQNWFCRSETHQQLKKACKSQIKNKVESDKFATKLEACLEKKIRKYKKQKAKVCKSGIDGPLSRLRNWLEEFKKNWTCH